MTTSTICPACGQEMAPENRLFCPQCGQPHHKSCVAQNGGCSVPNCGMRFAVPQPEPARSQVITTGGPPCPRCRRPADVRLQCCPHCGLPLTRGGTPAWVWALVACAAMFFLIIPILAAILVPNFIRARAQGQCTACKSNLKNLATALEMYSTDNAGRYPKSMSRLTEPGKFQYLKQIPRCPAAEGDTYSATYEVGIEPDAYTFFCRGDFHRAAGLSPDHPRYTSTQGLEP